MKLRILHLRFMFEYGEIYTCIWNTTPTDEYDGGPMPLDNFSLSNGVKSDIIQMCEEFQTSLDWDCPQDPSPWTEKHKRDFAARSKAIYDRLVAELGDDYILEYLPESFCR